MKAKKAYQLKKSKDIAKDLEDSLRSPDESPSTTSATTSTASASTEKTSSPSDPLLLILERLKNMQGRLSALEKVSTSVSSHEVNMAEATPVTEETSRHRSSSRNVFAVTEEEDNTVFWRG